MLASADVSSFTVALLLLLQLVSPNNAQAEKKASSIASTDAPPSTDREAEIIECCRNGSVRSPQVSCSYQYNLRYVRVAAERNERQKNRTHDAPLPNYLKAWRELILDNASLGNRQWSNASEAEEAKWARIEEAKKGAENRILKLHIEGVLGRHRTKQHSPAFVAAHQCLINEDREQMFQCCERANVSRDCMPLCDSWLLKRAANGNKLADVELRYTRSDCDLHSMKAALDCQYSETNSTRVRMEREQAKRTTTTTPAPTTTPDPGPPAPNKEREVAIVECCKKAGVADAARQCGYKYAYRHVEFSVQHDEIYKRSGHVPKGMTELHELFVHTQSDSNTTGDPIDKRQLLAEIMKRADKLPELKLFLEGTNRNTSVPPSFAAGRECPNKPRNELLACCKNAEVSSNCIAFCDSDLLNRAARGEGLALAELRVARLHCGKVPRMAALNCNYG